MSTMTVCDMCKKVISTRAGQDFYKVTSQSSNPQRKFVPSPKNLVNPSFHFDICENCAKKVREFISSGGK